MSEFNLIYFHKKRDLPSHIPYAMPCDKLKVRFKICRGTAPTPTVLTITNYNLTQT